LVFSDEDTIRHLFEVRIWVHVSKECDDLVIFFLNLRVRRPLPYLKKSKTVKTVYSPDCLPAIGYKTVPYHSTRRVTSSIQNQTHTLHY
jgi:hypothetical protein